MTVIIKSNQVATKSMGNIFGLNVASDYSLMLDFNLSEYRKSVKGVTTQLAFEDVIELTRKSRATYISPSNEVEIAEIDEPRIDYDKRSGKKGLLLEPFHIEHILDNFSAKTQTVTLVHNPRDKLILKVKGSGSATISGVVTVSDGSRSTATEGKSVLCETTKDGNAVITVNGTLEAISLQTASGSHGYSDKAFSAVGVTRVEGDNCILSPTLFNELIKDRADCTILVRTIGNEISVPDGDASSVLVYGLVESASSKKGIHATMFKGSGSRVTLRVVDESGDIVKSSLKVANDAVRNQNFAISYDSKGSNLISSRNGEVDVLNETYSLSPGRLILGSVSAFTKSGGLNGIITQIVVYPYKMTYEQMEDMTRL